MAIKCGGERAGEVGAYRASRLRLKVRLQVQRGVEIAAGVAAAAALHSVHAHRHGAVLVRRHRARGVREPALRLGPLARAPLELAAHLHTHTASLLYYATGRASSEELAASC